MGILTHEIMPIRKISRIYTNKALSGMGGLLSVLRWLTWLQDIGADLVLNMMYGMFLSL